MNRYELWEGSHRYYWAWDWRYAYDRVSLWDRKLHQWADKGEEVHAHGSQG